MMEFRIFRALGLSFSAWFRNFIPFTLLACILYAPVFIYLATYDFSKVQDIEKLLDNAFMTPLHLVTGLSALLAPMLTYRVVQQLNGTKVSMLTSIKYGVRGFLPALVLAVVTTILSYLPFGGIGNIILTCIWFVAAPAAVAERLGIGGAFSRSAELTRGRRWGIFGLTFVVGMLLVLAVLLWAAPMITSDELPSSLRGTILMFIAVMAVFQTFTGIVQAVSYALLRQDKDGVSHEELARVFE